MYRDDKLRAAQAAKRWTDDQLAEAAGVGRSSVIAITNGKAENPQLQTLKAICDALDLTMAEVFEAKEASAA